MAAASFSPPTSCADPVLVDDWHVVARMEELAAGAVRAVKLLGIDLVVWRSADQVQVWQDRCAHRAARLSLGQVRGQCLVCPYHGWTYNHTGTCVLIPAHPDQASAIGPRVATAHVEVALGLVWVCLGTPRQPVLTFPPWDQPGHRRVTAGPYVFRASAPRVMENFLDVGHYPFVHASHAGLPGRVDLPAFEVQQTETGLVAPDIKVRRVWKGPPESTAAVEVLYTYRTLRPLASTFTKRFGQEQFSMLDIVTPVDERESQVWTLMALNYDSGEPDEELVVYQDTVTAQDVPIVESQRPYALPLDFVGEIAVPSDRMAVAYRAWLKRLGLRFGTA